MNEHATSPLLGGVCFIVILLLIILQICFVSYYSCRLGKKVKKEDYDDEEFVAYKLTLSNTG